MCNIYDDNGFQDAAYKLYKKYEKLYPEDKEKIYELNKLLKDIKPMPQPENIEATKKDSVYIQNFKAKIIYI